MGWMGKILRVNLSDGSIKEEPLNRQEAIDYVGGRGLGTRILLKEVNPKCDPLSEDNKLIFLTGPLTGTGAPTGSRYMVITKSPLTGALTCSNSGGQFPTMLKRAGFDGIIFEGKAQNPVYLWICDGKAELRDAGHLWGKDTHETDNLLRNETKKEAKTAVIGPAGENKVLFASIMNDKDRAAGRSGVGAVMGSKNLKGVVVYGTSRPPIHDPTGFKAVIKDVMSVFKEATRDNPPPLRIYGTPITSTGTQNVGAYPTRNFQQGTFEHWQDIGGEVLTEKYLVKAKACFGCPIACGRVTRVENGPFKGEGEGPEYETIYALGSNCGINNLEAIIKANYICNEMGMDTITMGATIACAMEMFERGIIDEKIVGRSLKFGDAEALVELVQKTALREGFGDQLANGSLRLASNYGHPELAMVSKGQEFAGYEPRAEKGMGLAYATSPIGASHMRGDPAYIEILGVPMLVDPLSWEDKPQIVKDWQDVFAIIDSAGLCVFFSVRFLVSKTKDIRPVKILELLNCATGANYTMESLMTTAERIINAERVFLVKAGFSAKDDTLPPRMLKEPMPTGPAKGHVCELDKMLPIYYKLRNWDENGIPKPELLERLGLK